jgi:serine/threonine protein kinase/tetratricopeptide (TPR) repeat protein
VGAGGQGEVWRARDPEQGEIALKILSPALTRNSDAWAALQREHEIASRLDHPLILKVFAPVRTADAAVLPMEFAPGGDLRRLRGVSYLEIVPVLIEVTRALEHAHSLGVIHRDLKPGNVLFDARGHVKIADFGVSGTVLGEGPSSTGVAGLSPFTASPQQLRGERPAIADDLYGLGALSYELLSGYPPYYPRFDLRRVLEERVPELKTTHQAPRRLIDLVMALLAKEPRERPASMREVIETLDATLNDTLTFDLAEVQDEEQDTPEPPASPRSDLTLPSPLPEMALRTAVAAPRAVPSEVIRIAPAHPRAATPVEADNDGPQRPAVAKDVPSGPDIPTSQELRALWSQLEVKSVPSLMRYEPQRARRWPGLVLFGLAATAAASFYYLPRLVPPSVSVDFPRLSALFHDRSRGPVPAATSVTPTSPSGGSVAQPARDSAAELERLNAARASFEARLAALDGRAAGVWGGKDYVDAKARAAEATTALEVRDLQTATQRLAEANRLLGAVEDGAARPLTTQLAAGNEALRAGNTAAARQAFELARRIDEHDARPARGLSRTKAAEAALPLLAEASNAERAHDYARAARDYGKVLALDAANTAARDGLARSRAALGVDSYAKAVGTGFAALGAGRLEDARVAFEQARKINPNGYEARQGLERVNIALRGRDLGELRLRASAFEAAERWDDAVHEYDTALKIDPSLTFARQGRSRAAARAELAGRMQALIDDPQRLGSPGVHTEAAGLIRDAEAQQSAGPVMRSLAARLAILLPEYDKPVHLALVSDNATQVAIPQIGTFGTFARRDIELKPGKYTVIGRRAGYRDVRRDVTVAPGQDVQTISVRCVEPI